MEDTLNMEDDEELEEEADAEVDKVLFDLTDGKLGQAGAAKTDLPVRSFFPLCYHIFNLELHRQCNWTKKRSGISRSIAPNWTVCSVADAQPPYLSLYTYFEGIQYIPCSIDLTIICIPPYRTIGILLEKDYQGHCRRWLAKDPFA